jgi:hypothetical protein
MTLFERLIKQELKFCCIYAFFKLQKRTGAIADRLGMTDRTVRYHKARWRAKEYKCEGCPNCLKGRLF